MVIGITVRVVLELGDAYGSRCDGESGGGYSMVRGGKTWGGRRGEGEEESRIPVILGGETPAGYRH